MTDQHSHAPSARFLAQLPESTRDFVQRKLDERAARAPSAPQNERRREIRKPAPALADVLEKRQAARALTSKERRARQLERDHATELRLVDKLAGKIVAAGGRIGPPPPAAPAMIWRMSWSIVADTTTEIAQMWIAKCPNRTAAGLIARGVLGEDLDWARASGQSPRALRARREIAHGLAQVYLAKPTRRRGRWGALSMGYPRPMFAALLRDVTARVDGTPHVNAVFGTHRPEAEGRARKNGDVGYFVKLRDLGLVYRQQLPKDEAYACETWGRSGYATNRYWIVADGAPETITDDELREAVFGFLATADAARRAWHHLRHYRTRAGAHGPPAAAPPPS